MPLLPYVVPPPRGVSPAVDAIRARRGGHLLNLDRMLLHSPPFAAGWNVFLRAVRNDLSIPADWRELAICFIAVLNRADYEFEQHAPEYLASGGRQAALDALRHGAGCLTHEAFSGDERTVLLLTLAMTRDVDVPPPVLDAARAVVGSDQALVELVGLIAAYNMVSRFLVATGVSVDGEASGDP